MTSPTSKQFHVLCPAGLLGTCTHTKPRITRTTITFHVPYPSGLPVAFSTSKCHDIENKRKYSRLFLVLCPAGLLRSRNTSTSHDKFCNHLPPMRCLARLMRTPNCHLQSARQALSAINWFLPFSLQDYEDTRQTVVYDFFFESTIINSFLPSWSCKIDADIRQTVVNNKN